MTTNPLKEVLKAACCRTFRAGKATGNHVPNAGFFGSAFAEHFPKGTAFGSDIKGQPCLKKAEGANRVEVGLGKVADLSELGSSTQISERLFADALLTAAQEVFPYHKVRDHKPYFESIVAFRVPETVAA